MKIKQKFIEDMELGIKRFYPTGVIIESECPECGKEIIFNGNNRHIEYPAINNKEEVQMYCEDCDCSFSEHVVIRVSIEKWKE